MPYKFCNNKRCYLEGHIHYQFEHNWKNKEHFKVYEKYSISVPDNANYFMFNNHEKFIFSYIVLTIVFLWVAFYDKLF